MWLTKSKLCCSGSQRYPVLAAATLSLECGMAFACLQFSLQVQGLHASYDRCFILPAALTEPMHNITAGTCNVWRRCSSSLSLTSPLGSIITVGFTQHIKNSLPHASNHLMHLRLPVCAKVCNTDLSCATHCWHRPTTLRWQVH